MRGLWRYFIGCILLLVVVMTLAGFGLTWHTARATVERPAITAARVPHLARLASFWMPYGYIGRGGRIGLTFSPDSSLLAGVNYRYLSVWDLNSGSRRFTQQYTLRGNVPRFSPDGVALTADIYDPAAAGWALVQVDVATGTEERWELALPPTPGSQVAEFHGLVYDGDGRLLAYGRDSNGAVAWQPRSGDERARPASLSLASVLPLPGANPLTWSDRGGQLFISDFHDTTPPDIIPHYGSYARLITASADGGSIAFVTRRGEQDTIDVWARAELAQRFSLRFDGALHLALSPRGDLLAVTYLGGVVFFDADGTFRGELSLAGAAQTLFSPDGTLLAVGRELGDVLIYGVGSPRL